MMTSSQTLFHKYRLITGYNYGNDDDADHVYFIYFENVSNSNDILKKVLANELPACALINSSLICDKTQLIAAATHTMISSRHSDMKTRGLYTELIHNLSPSPTKIAYSLKTFSVQPSSTTLLIGVFNATDDVLTQLQTSVHGDIVNLSKLRESCDVSEITRLYDVSANELKLYSPCDDALIDAICGRVATFHCLRNN